MLLARTMSEFTDHASFAMINKSTLKCILRHQSFLPEHYIKQIDILLEWSNVIHRKFLAIFQAESPVEIRPCQAPLTLDHILEFEDGTEVYDVAVHSLNCVTPRDQVVFTNAYLQES